MKLIECEITWMGSKIIIRRIDNGIVLIRNKQSKGIDFDTFIHCTEVGTPPDFSNRLGCTQYRTAVLTPSGIDRAWWSTWPDLQKFFYPNGLPAELILIDKEEAREETGIWKEPLFKPMVLKANRLPSSASIKGSHEKKVIETELEDTTVRYSGVMIADAKTGHSIQINKDPRLTEYMLSGRSAVDNNGVSKMVGAVVNVVGPSNAKGHANDEALTRQPKRGTRKR